jgi:hypothetical protein
MKICSQTGEAIAPQLHCYVDRPKHGGPIAREIFRYKRKEKIAALISSW